MDLLGKREDELTKIYRYTGRGFFFSYIAGTIAYSALRGRGMPYFKDFVKHGVLCVGGTFISALLAEKIASETYYNTLLI